MRRVLFTWGGIEVHSYPAMLYLGLVAGVVTGNLAAHRSAIDPPRVLAAQLILIPFALVGARLFHVLFHWRHYHEEPRRILAGREGGGDMFGGLPVAMLLSLPLLALLKLPFWGFWDVTAFTILVGMVITRFGCLLNGCCGGKTTTGWLGLELGDVNGVVRRRVPMQLLEAGWTLLVLLAAVRLWPRTDLAGQLFCFAMGAYSVGRVVLDRWREEQYPWFGRVTVHQALYGAVAVLCALGWARGILLR